MNPFMALGALISAGAGTWAVWHGDWLMAVIYFCWAIADIAAGLKG